MTDPRIGKLETELKETIDKLEGFKVRSADSEDAELTDEETDEYEGLLSFAETLKAKITKLKDDEAKIESSRELIASLASVGSASSDQKVRSYDTPAKGDLFYHWIKSDVAQMANGVPSEDSRRMLTRSVVTGTTTDVPGLLPYTIANDLIEFVDAQRYTIDSLNLKQLPPGASFRQRVRTGNTTIEESNVEDTAITNTTNVQVDYVETFHERVRGGVELSFEEVQWADRDVLAENRRWLAEDYAVKTDTLISAAFKTACTNTYEELVMDTDVTPKELVDAILTADIDVYDNSKSRSNKIWVSPGVKNLIAGMVGTDGHFAFPTINPENRGGQGGTTTSWAGFQVAGLPVVVCPNFASPTMILGNDQWGTVYEQLYGTFSSFDEFTGRTRIALWGGLGSYFRAEGFVKFIAVDGSGATPIQG